MNKRTKWLLVIGVIATLVVGVQVAAFASHPLATLAGSNFEIDVDANLKQDHDGDPDPAMDDWATIAHNTGPPPDPPVPGTEVRGVDLPTGADDDSYKGGVKEDTVCPGETTGSIPNNKSDLRTFHVYEEEGAPGFLNLAWSRVTDPSGTTLMDFEFNQSSTPCSVGPNVLRSQDDLLIEYLIDQGGARAEVTGRFWQGNATSGQWGDPIDLTEPNTLCDGAPCAAGTINTTAIPAAEADGIDTSPDDELAPRTFGEAQIDLRLLFDEGECVNFGSAMLKSRSSDSFTSQPKDFIAPVPIDINNCGKVIIHKQTNPDTNDLTGPEFTYAENITTDPAQVNTPSTPFDESTGFKLRDDGTNEITGVLPATDLTVEELLGTNLPTGGWEFASVDCTETQFDDPLDFVGNVVPTDITGAKVTFDIASADDVLECTYFNQQRVTTMNTAQSVFPNDSATVSGTLGVLPTGNVTFKLYGPDPTPGGITTDNCSGDADFTQEVALAADQADPTKGTASTANGIPNSGPVDYAVTDSTEGLYWWQVSYAGDTNNPPILNSCRESTLVTIDNDGAATSTTP